MSEKLSKNPEEIRPEQTEKDILQEFEEYLKEGNLQLAKRIKERFENIDFSQIIKAEFERRLKREEVWDAVILKKELGEGIDFSQAITEEATEIIKQEFKRLLERYRAREASYIKEELEQWIDFSEIITKYSHQIKEEFKYYLTNGTIRYAGRIKRVMGEGIEADLDRIFDDFVANESKFNNLLEETRREPLEDVKGLFEFPSLAGKPGEPIEEPQIARRHLYIARTFALYPEQYEDLVNYLEERKIDTQYFKGEGGSRLEEIRNLQNLLNNIAESENEIDTKKLSYNLEIEILNKDRILEKETGITNNYQEILKLVEALDNFNQRLINDMRALKKEEKIVGLYDSVHINIGIPKKEAADAMDEDIRKKRGLFKVLDLLGLIYNPLGRSAYMLKTHYLDRIMINRSDVKYEYPAKLQDRLWCFRFTGRNRFLLGLMLTYLTKIINLYCEDPNKAREKAETDATEITKIIKENSTPYGELIDQEGRIYESKVRALGEPSFPYYDERKVILKKVLEYLEETYKISEQLKEIREICQKR